MKIHFHPDMLKYTGVGICFTFIVYIYKFHKTELKYEYTSQFQFYRLENIAKWHQIIHIRCSDISNLFLQTFNVIIGLTDFSGWSYDLTPVRQQVWCYLAFSPKWLIRIFLIFCSSIEDNRAHRLSQIAFLEKFLILDYRGLSVQKRCFFYFFAFLKNDSKDLPIFLHDCRGQ